jgi:transcriptional/translational regulatory protein YebC/TACO1
MIRNEWANAHPKISSMFTYKSVTLILQQNNLRKFELGENFFEKVLFADVVDTEDKQNFYIGTLINALTDLQRKLKTKNNHLEAGFQIESDLDDNFTKEQHEMLLGFYWWKAIYKTALKAEQFTTEEFDELERKLKSFCRQIYRLEELS